MKIAGFVWIALIFILGGGFLLLLISSRNNNSNIPTSGTLPIQIEVYSDYNCPHCANFAPFVADVKATFGDQVDVKEKLVPFLSETSYGYAYAAEASRLQGKFDEYNMELFKWISFQRGEESSNFTYTDEEKSFYSNSVNVTSLAEKLGLDVVKFDEDRKSSAVVNSVQEQKSELSKRLNGALSTPTVFIYGEKFQLSTYEDLKVKVQELINTAIEKENENK